MLDKTTQTIDALKKLAQENPYCEIKMIVFVHKSELQGFDILELKSKFRAKKPNHLNEIQDAI